MRAKLTGFKGGVIGRSPDWLKGAEVEEDGVQLQGWAGRYVELIFDNDDKRSKRNEKWLLATAQVAN